VTRRPWIAFALAGVATFLVWVPSLSNGFVWDDEANVLGNDGFRGFDAAHLRWMFTAFHMGHYHPLTWLTFAVDHALWGLDPVGYHLTNAVLHALSAVVLARIAAWFFERATEESGPAASWAGAFVALAWSLHPLRVEAVSWITQRREVLCGLLALLAVASRLGRRPWPLTTALALAAMLAKVTAVTVPVLLVLVDLHESGGFAPGWPRRLGRAVARQAHLFAAAVALTVTSFLAQRDANAMVSTEFLPPASRLALYFFGLVFCAAKTLVPTGLAPLHQGQVGFTWDLQPWVWWTAGAGLAIAAALAVVAWRARLRRPRLLLLPIAWLALLAPAGGLGQSGPQIAAERYTYQPAWVLTLALGLGLWMAAPRGRALVAGVVVIALGAASIAQQRHWHDTESLWRRELAVHPDNAFAGFVLGYHYLSRTPPDLAQAEGPLRRAVANGLDYVDAERALAGVLRATGRSAESYEILAAFERGHPENAEAYRLQAKAFAADRRIAEAVAAFERGLARGPSPGLVSDYAWMLATDPDPSARDGRRALELAKAVTGGAPRDPRAAVMFAAACAEAGELDLARKAVEAVISSGAGAQEGALRKLLSDLEQGKPVRAEPRFP
jgi:tetratricopeptide (TPR) repeat protein